MKLLLDTHALVWFLEDDPALSPRARAAIEARDSVSYVSHASIWEMAIKTSLGKLRLPVPFDDLFPTRVESFGLELLPLRLEHFRRLLPMPQNHRDPFDRLLIAQALVEGLTLVTRDAHFAQYGAPLLW